MSPNTPRPAQPIRANVLGDVRAESDARMLDVAFYESPDYRTLIESPERSIIVGRRGTGKSALAYMIGRHFERSKEADVIRIGPDEHEILGLRPLANRFGDKFRLIRAGSTIAWRYGLFMEITEKLQFRYKAKKHPSFRILEPHLQLWRTPGGSFGDRMKALLRRKTKEGANPEEIIGDLPQLLELSSIEAALKAVFADGAARRVVILLDRLDEGYEPDDVGVGLIDGLVQATLDVKGKLDFVQPLVFLRDNVYRAIARQDPDYSRTIEAQTIRLHWDEYNLLNLAANRLRAAFSIDQEQSIRVWDRCADAGLDGKEGFRKCLRLTLYRPRDLLILLNNAFLDAAQQDRRRIIPSDIEASARSISMNRLDDLRKEYTSILPSLPVMADAFSGSSPELTVQQAWDRLLPVIADGHHSPEVLQYFAIVSVPNPCLRDLYSVGFLGLKDGSTGNFVFCHDGRNPNREFESDQSLLIHPCYWIALNLVARDIEQDAAEEIYDEYEIAVASETPKQRAAVIGRLIAEEGKIPLGKAGWREFEQWALKTVQIIFAGKLTNIQLHANGASAQQRDIVARNSGETGFWGSIRADYETRQVIFEVKNYSELTPEDFRQGLAYSTKEYGRALFFVCHAESDDLPKGPELDWVRILHHEHNRLAVKLSSKALCRLLGKLRSPQKHDEVDKYMESIVDRYVRLYFASPRSKN